jgi:hypothetical protein
MAGVMAPTFGKLDVIPREVLQDIVKSAQSTIPDYLRCALVNRSFRTVTLERLCESAVPYTDADLLDPAVAQTFPHWPKLAVAAVPAPRDNSSGFGDVFVCKSCRRPVMSASHIMSANYHNACGKAYLVSAVVEVDQYGPLEQVRYTTGNYTVQHVRCRSPKCHTELGVAYLASEDPDNNYKVGTFMIGQRLVEQPPCCAGRASVAPGDMCDCCAHRGAVRSCALVARMTERLDPGLSRSLLADLEAEGGPASSERARSLHMESRLRMVRSRSARGLGRHRDLRLASFLEMVRADMQLRVRQECTRDDGTPRRFPGGAKLLRTLCVRMGTARAKIAATKAAFATRSRALIHEGARSVRSVGARLLQVTRCFAA